MSFLNPIMLFGLAAVAAPILIHLLNRRRVQRVVWAAMRFLNISVERNQRRMRLEDWILLAIRCGLVALLALALARPSFESVGSVLGTSKSTAVLLVDNSYSMAMSDGAETRFEKARRTAEHALQSLGAGSAAAVWFVSDIVQTPIPEPTLDLNLARKALREGTISDRTTDVLPALTRAVEVLRSSFGLRKELYLFTDGQALGWQQFDQILKVCANASRDMRLHVIVINEHERRNIGVSDLQMASGLSPARHPLRFQARITNFGQDEARETRIALSVDGNAPSDEFTIPTLAPGASQSVPLFAKLETVGFHRVAVSIGTDRLRADDMRECVVRAISEVRVLLVNGEPGADNRDNETFFLEQALAPVPRRSRPEYFLKCRVVAPGDLPSVSLNDFDAVMLANVPEFPVANAKELNAFVRRGGGLIVFPGAATNTRFYNEHLADGLRLLPAKFEAVVGDARQDERFLTLQSKDYYHPVVSIWSDPASGNLASARFFQHLRLALAADENAPPAIVLSYSDGSPALVEWTVGLGRVFQFGSTADTAWNDWPVRTSFVPMVHRTLGAIVQRRDETLNVTVGDAFVRRTAPEFLDKEAVVRREGEVPGAAEGRKIELVNNSPTLRFEGTDRAGVFSVRLAEPPMAELFAVQANSVESNLEELSSQQLQTLGQFARVLTWSPNFSFRGEMGRARGGSEFWMPLLLVGTALALVELLLAQWFSRST